jgi:hypothetical protein
MAGPTTELRQEIQRLDRIIARIAAKPRGERRVWAPTLQHLERERRSLARIVSARRALAGEKIVELRRWREPPELSH